MKDSSLVGKDPENNGIRYIYPIYHINANTFYELIPFY